jgi:hypothetical protein
LVINRYFWQKKIAEKWAGVKDTLHQRRLAYKVQGTSAANPGIELAQVCNEDVASIVWEALFAQQTARLKGMSDPFVED